MVGMEPSPRHLEDSHLGTAQQSERVLPSKIQTLGFLVSRATSLCERINNMTDRCGVPTPVASADPNARRDSQDYITQLEIHLEAMDSLIQSMDNYMTELERII